STLDRKHCETRAMHVRLHPRAKRQGSLRGWFLLISVQHMLTEDQIPRVYRLQMSDIALELEKDLEATCPASASLEGTLLELISDEEDEVQVPMIETWSSLHGGSGVYGLDSRHLLGEIGSLTGTEITLIDGGKKVQIAAKNMA